MELRRPAGCPRPHRREDVGRDHRGHRRHRDRARRGRHRNRRRGLRGTRSLGTPRPRSSSKALVPTRRPLRALSPLVPLGPGEGAGMARGRRDQARRDLLPRSLTAPHSLRVRLASRRRTLHSLVGIGPRRAARHLEGRVAGHDGRLRGPERKAREVAGSGAAVYKQGYCRGPPSGSWRAQTAVSGYEHGIRPPTPRTRRGSGPRTGTRRDGGSAPTVTVGATQAIAPAGAGSGGHGDRDRARRRQSRAPPPRGVVHAAAVPLKTGRVAVLVVIADQGVSDASPTPTWRRSPPAYAPPPDGMRVEELARAGQAGACPSSCCSGGTGRRADGGVGRAASASGSRRRSRSTASVTRRPSTT